ncbi:N-acetyltransferase [Halomonas sp. Choline-3u-9]|nr:MULTISPECIES: GNAT family N-acetyltransferase [unclassified Halomonas]PKH63601.1 N-acetyltransferase [Halomonas sp. Choline-3u-9]QGQ69722.1 GNAT family N-acetyltransferase [Halomonas sp. PA16-9]
MQRNTQPSFNTNHLTLRPRRLSDLEECLRMDRDPEVTRFVQGPWHKPSAHRSFVVERIEQVYPSGLGYWTIRDRETEKFYGWVLLIPYHVLKPEVEIGWRLVRDAWGKGVATEAAKIILEHGLNTVGLPRIVADIDPQNIASARVAEKISMKYVEDRILGGSKFLSFQSRSIVAV